MKVKDMTLTAVTAALVCVAGPLTISAGPVPLSLATFAVYLAGAILGKKRGTAAVGLYLLIGLAGMPVFSLRDLEICLRGQLRRRAEGFHAR